MINLFLNLSFEFYIIFLINFVVDILKLNINFINIKSILNAFKYIIATISFSYILNVVNYEYFTQTKEYTYLAVFSLTL